MTPMQSASTNTAADLVIRATSIVAFGRLATGIRCWVLPLAVLESRRISKGMVDASPRRPILAGKDE